MSGRLSPQGKLKVGMEEFQGTTKIFDDSHQRTLACRDPSGVSFPDSSNQPIPVALRVCPGRSPAMRARAMWWSPLDIAANCSWSREVFAAFSQRV